MAKTNLRMGGLFEPTGRGVFKITPRGLELLKTTQDRIDLRLLRNQPGYLEARDRKRDKPDGHAELVSADPEQTPEELMEQSFEALRESLGREILVKLKGASPAFFERLVVELLVRMGYGATRKGSLSWGER